MASDKCCGCIELKTGCFIIGYLKLICEVILAIIVCIVVGQIEVNEKYNHYEEYQDVSEVTNTMKIILRIMQFLIFVAIAFTVALLVGLHKNKREFIKGYLIFEVIWLGINVLIALMLLSENGDIAFQAWFSIGMNIQFILVVRRYYNKLGDEDNKPQAYDSIEAGVNAPLTGYKGPPVYGPGEAGYNGPPVCGPVEAEYKGPPVYGPGDAEYKSPPVYGPGDAQHKDPPVYGPGDAEYKGPPVYGPGDAQYKDQPVYGPGQLATMGQ